MSPEMPHTRNRGKRRCPRRQRPTFRPRFEGLEPRLLLAGDIDPFEGTLSILPDVERLEDEPAAALAAAPEADITFSTERISEKAYEQDFGKALSLDGAGDYVSIAPFDAISSTMKAEAWFKVDQFDRAWQTIISKHGIFEITRNDQTDTLAFTFANDRDNRVIGQTNVNDGNWHHVSATFTLSGAEMSLFVDGESDGTHSLEGGPVFPWNNSNTLIGARTETGVSADRHFNGLIDDVRIWGDGSLIGQYNFDDEAATDQSGNGNHGVLVGNPTFEDSEPLPISGYVEVALSAAVTAEPGIILNYEISSGSTAVQGTDFYSSQLDINTTDANLPTNSIFIAKGETTGRRGIRAV